jgi:hypothetical protein
MVIKEAAPFRKSFQSEVYGFPFPIDLLGEGDDRIDCFAAVLREVAYNVASAVSFIMHQAAFNYRLHSMLNTKVV